MQQKYAYFFPKSFNFLNFNLIDKPGLRDNLSFTLYPNSCLGNKKLSLRVTTDSDTVFRKESIGEGFKIVTVAVFEKILLFEKKLVRLWPQF